MRGIQMSSNSRKYTIFGFITILIWGTSAVFTRTLSTNLGAYTAAALVNFIGGVTVLGQQFVTGNGTKDLKKVPRLYWPVCGFLFILYTSTSYVSMSMVAKEEAVITLVLIRFLWPLFTLIFTIPILKQKASVWLIGGITLSFIGIVIAKLGNDIFDLPNFIHNITSGDDLPAFLLGFVVAISWGLYTNLTKKFIGTRDVDGVGIYMVGSGIILGIIALFTDEPRHFTPVIISQVIYASIVVTCVANVLWNLAIKKGNMLIVVLASNFLPIISTVMTSFLLGVPITLPVIVGSIFVVAGTCWSKKCFH
jgi:drug/metabolite transporter (DMT)-like permease